MPCLQDCYRGSLKHRLLQSNVFLRLEITHTPSCGYFDLSLPIRHLASYLRHVESLLLLLHPFVARNTRVAWGSFLHSSRSCHIIVSQSVQVVEDLCFHSSDRCLIFLSLNPRSLAAVYQSLSSQAPIRSHPDSSCQKLVRAGSSVHSLPANG